VIKQRNSGNKNKKGEGAKNGKIAHYTTEKGRGGRRVHEWNDGERRLVVWLD
jgi:hypothetical protein